MTLFAFTQLIHDEHLEILIIHNSHYNHWTVVIIHIIDMSQLDLSFVVG